MISDKLGRQVKDLRISVTDRCNFRCAYCMPFDRYEWIDRKEILTFEEITRLAGIFVRLGVDKIRLTGGEPLLRRNLPVLVSRLSRLPGMRDLCLTTNGSFLAKAAPDLAAAGVRRLNVSLDTLVESKFQEMSGRNDLPKVLEGLSVAAGVGLGPIKINTVVRRGVNDGEILPLVEFARRHGFSVRFIEFMDAGNVNDWRVDKIVSKKEILEKISPRFALVESERERGSAPAVEYRFADGNGEVGFIASVTEPFCKACTRARLTADGKLVTCLFSERSHDLKAMLRGGADDAQIAQVIMSVWEARTDRYSEERAANLQSGDVSRKKIEMIRLGG